jgi:hypothetical protein
MMSACGGGTTGTSSTDSLKFSGYAETANGQRASDLSMSVQSAATDQTLVDSGTDRRGDFSMALPSDESGFLVIVDGVGEATIVRNQSGAGTMTSKLAATSNGALMVKDLFETQIDPISLCSGLTADGDLVMFPRGAVRLPSGYPQSSSHLTPSGDMLWVPAMEFARLF